MKNIVKELALVWRLGMLCVVFIFPVFVIMSSLQEWDVAEKELNKNNTQILIVIGNEFGSKRIIDGKIDLSDYFEQRSYVLFPTFFTKPHMYIVTKRHDQSVEVELIYFGALFTFLAYCLSLYLFYFYWIRKKGLYQTLSIMRELLARLSLRKS